MIMEKKVKKYKKKEVEIKGTIERHKLVIDEWFINNFNGAKAAKKIYKYLKNDNSAYSTFNRIKNIPEIQEYIKYKFDEVARVLQTSHAGILMKLKVWIECDLTEAICFSKEEIQNLPTEIRLMVTGHKTKIDKYYDSEGNLKSTTEQINLQFFSKEKAIDMINRHIGFYEKDNLQKVPEITIITSNERHKDLINNILEGE